jgi:putative FmdB family regulatory protein
MPVYTYRCESCGVQFERSQKFSDAPLTRCPECGKKTLRKVYTPVGIVFKGSGFYSTDHKSPSGAPRYAGGPSEGKSENRSENKSEDRSENRSDDRSENRSEESGKTESKPAASPSESPSNPKTEKKD